MSSWYVYMARGRSGALYTGITTDLQRRLREHNSGTRGSKWARKERPLALVFAQRCENHSDALRAEHKIKSWSHERKECIIQGDQSWTVETSPRASSTR